MSYLDTELERRIRQALAHVHQAAGASHQVGGVVPLRDLFDAFPVTVDEVPALTYRKAAQHVAARSGYTAIPVPSQGERPLAGLLFAYWQQRLGRACVLIRQDDPVERRRFTAAHELGHFLLHFLLVAGPAPGRMLNGPTLLEGLSHTDDEALSEPDKAGEVIGEPASLDVQQMEREANAFAAALLMPEESCRALVEAYSARYGSHRAVLARRMAPDFLVSKLAMQWRLENLELGTV